MPTPQLALPQQFGRFLLAGALIFTILFWGLSSVLMSNQDVHRDIAAVISNIHDRGIDVLDHVQVVADLYELRRYCRLLRSGTRRKSNQEDKCQRFSHILISARAKRRSRTPEDLS